MNYHGSGKRLFTSWIWPRFCVKYIKIKYNFCSNLLKPFQVLILSIFVLCSRVDVKLVLKYYSKLKTVENILYNYLNFFDTERESKSQGHTTVDYEFFSFSSYLSDNWRPELRITTFFYRFIFFFLIFFFLLFFLSISLLFSSFVSSCPAFPFPSHLPIHVWTSITKL